MAKRRRTTRAGRTPASPRTAPQPGPSRTARLASWVGLGLAPPLAASSVLLAYASTEPAGVIGGIAATVVNFALVIMALTTFNVLVQARAQWAAAGAETATYVSGLASSAGVAIGGLVAYLLTASLMTALVLMVVSLGGALALYPRR